MVSFPHFFAASASRVYASLPFSTSSAVIPIVAATCDIDASNELPVSTAASATSFIPSASSLRPVWIAPDMRFALSTSPKTEVCSTASFVSFPYSSIELAHLSVESDASLIYFSVLLSSDCIPCSSACALLIAVLYDVVF